MVQLLQTRLSIATPLSIIGIMFPPLLPVCSPCLVATLTIRPLIFGIRGLFLAKVRRLIPSYSQGSKFKLGVDCGAGIGRTTEGFLSQVCEVVDALEPVDKFTEVLRSGPLKRDGVVGDIYTMGIENWNPDKDYDLIWTQFCVGHLIDFQLID